MAAHQAPPSLGFSRQECWSGLPFPSPMHESEKWKWSCSVVRTANSSLSSTHQPQGKSLPVSLPSPLPFLSSTGTVLWLLYWAHMQSSPSPFSLENCLITCSVWCGEHCTGATTCGLCLYFPICPWNIQGLSFFICEMRTWTELSYDLPNEYPGTGRALEWF